MRRSCRTSAFLVLIAMSSLPFCGQAVAGGGLLPSIPPTFTQLNTSSISAVIVLDPNGPVSPVDPTTFQSQSPATPTGTFGTIAITRPGYGTASSAFQVQPDSTLGELKYGCNLSLTNSRFVNLGSGVGNPPGGPDGVATNWLSAGLTTQLFSHVGVSLVQSGNVVMIPAVTGVISQQCQPFPKPSKAYDNLLFGDILRHLNVTPSSYPDLPANSDSFAQWVSGFLVLQVNIGFWVDPNAGTQTPE